MTGVFESEANADGVARGCDAIGEATGVAGRAAAGASNALAGVSEGWSGPRSEVFDLAAHRLLELLTLVGQRCGEVVGVLGDLLRAIRVAEHELEHLRRQVAALPPHLLTPGLSLPGPAGEPQRRADALADQAARVRADLDRVEQRVAAAVDALTDRLVPRLSALPTDVVGHRVWPTSSGTAPAGATGPDRLAAALVTLGGLLLDAPGASGLRPPPGTTATPRQVTRWWTTLSAAQRDLLLRTDPRRYGNLDGVPALDRDLANRISLPLELAGLRAQLRREFPDGEPARLHVVHSSYDLGALTSTSRSWSRWEDLRQRVVGSLVVQDRVARVGTDGEAFLLLGFAPRRGRGRAIVSHGDPDRAAHTNLSVAGTTARLGEIAHDIVRTEAARTAAVSADGRPLPRASITWYGYDAPPTVAGHARHLRYADDGAPLLDSFAAGLRATHEPASRSHTTLVAHSYGTTLAGRAASGGRRLEVDDLVLVASPGVGVGHGWLGEDGTTVDDLHLSGASRGHVFATRSRADPIRWATDTHLGVDPTRAGFGATVFGAAPDTGHDGYWTDPDGPSLKALGLVVAGRGSSVAPATLAQEVHPSALGEHSERAS